MFLHLGSDVTFTIDQELGNWETAVDIFETVSTEKLGDAEQLVPKPWLRDISVESVSYLRVLLSIRNTLASSCWKDLEVTIFMEEHIFHCSQDAYFMFLFHLAGASQF
jgi:hypothetical protein